MAKLSTRCALQTLQTEGVAGLYRGMMLPLATVAVFNAILFSARGTVNALLAHADGAPATQSSFEYMLNPGSFQSRRFRVAERSEGLMLQPPVPGLPPAAGSPLHAERCDVPPAVRSGQSTTGLVNHLQARR